MASEGSLEIESVGLLDHWREVRRPEGSLITMPALLRTVRALSLSRLPADYPRIRTIITCDDVGTALGRSSIQQPPLARFLARGSKLKSDALPTELRDQNVIELHGRNILSS